jgi:hypothetical protein
VPLMVAGKLIISIDFIYYYYLSVRSNSVVFYAARVVSEGKYVIRSSQNILFVVKFCSVCRLISGYGLIILLFNSVF